MAKGLDAGQKDDLLRNFSAELRIDYDAFCAKRLLQIMTLAEAAELAKQGVDFQLHTHRHRVSKNREKFLKEIDDNRTRLGQVTATKEATHFCYPGGYYRAEFPGWLAGHGVVSATTCNAGIAGPESQMHLLPRFIDTMYAPPVEFRSWLSGLAALLPHRAHVMSDGQLMEEWAWRPEVLPLVSSHVATGAPLPREELARLLATRTFHKGLAAVRQLEFALFDFRLHAEYRPEQGAALERLLTSVREQVAVVRPPAWNRFAHSVLHVFAGGYAAGYYSYKWAEVLAADAFAAFAETSVFDAATARRFLEEILSRGGSRDQMEAFVAFRGRKPEVRPLLRKDGLAA